MGSLRYTINITLDGCCDHTAISPDDELHSVAIEAIERADALLYGRVTYEMMETAWRDWEPSDELPEWTGNFARSIDAARKYVVSNTLDEVDWNSELVAGDLATAVAQIKEASPGGVSTGGVTLPLALANLGLIDEYEFLVHPAIAGHGPTLFAGLSEPLDLRLVDRRELGSGAMVMRYEPRR